jgi:hypothetical protein
LKKHKLLFFGVLALAGFLLLGRTLTSRPGLAEVTPEDRVSYLAALRDAAVSEQEEISRDLVAIVPGWDAINRERLGCGSLVWEGAPGRSRVLAASFMARNSYNGFYKAALEAGSADFVLSRSLWVTVVPELRNHFRGRYPRRMIPTAKRIKQVLGLHPAYDYDVLVEMFVDPADRRPIPRSPTTKPSWPSLPPRPGRNGASRAIKIRSWPCASTLFTRIRKGARP